MRQDRQKTDVLKGVLKAEGYESPCTVSLATRLSSDSPSVAVWSSLRITSVDIPAPDGRYSLNVHGRIFQVLREGGKWPALQL